VTTQPSERGVVTVQRSRRRGVSESTKATHEAFAGFYDGRAADMESLRLKLRPLIEELLLANDLEVHAVTSRTKSKSSFLSKGEANGFERPEQILDFCGLRVITYFESEARRAAAILEGLFDVVPGDVKDKAKELGRDRLGYRAIHMIGKISDQRAALPEWGRHRDRMFEIQVTTVLQHAWSQFEHDRSYKFGEGELPETLDRRLRLAAGLLEIADRELDQIADEVEKYRDEIAKQLVASPSPGASSILLDFVSLQAFVGERLPRLARSAETRLISERGGQTAVAELRSFGVETLEDLARLVPPDFEARYESPSVGYMGIARTLMLINDARRYLESVWGRHWLTIPEWIAKVLRSYDVQIDSLAAEFGFAIGRELARPPRRESRPQEEDQGGG